MKQIKNYIFKLAAFLGLFIAPFAASAQEAGLGESIDKFLNDTGFARLVDGNWLCLVMIGVACILFYLAIVKKFEPLLLLPIAFGMLLTNLPGAGLYHPELFEGGHIHWPDFANANNVGLLDYIYIGVKLGIYPCIIFIGVGAMTDFGPLLANPKSFLLGAAAQLGIFVTFLGALGLRFTYPEAGSIAIIGGADGPTAIYLTSKLAPGLLGPIAVAAYSYMALVPVIQPPIMKMLTTKKEREIVMKQLRKDRFPDHRYRIRIFIVALGSSFDRLFDARQPDARMRRCRTTEQDGPERTDEHHHHLPGDIRRSHDHRSSLPELSNTGNPLNRSAGLCHRFGRWSIVG